MNTNFSFMVSSRVLANNFFVQGLWKRTKRNNFFTFFFSDLTEPTFQQTANQREDRYVQIFWGLSLYGSLQLSLEGVLPYISHNKGMCCPKGDGFAPFWSENWYRLCPFWSGIGYGFQGNYWSGRMHCSFQFQMSKKERERFYIYVYVFFVAALI